METALYIVLAISQAGLIIYYFLYHRKKKQKEAERRAALSREFPYDVLRTMALTTMPGAMLATIPEGQIAVYSVVMDWDMGSDIVTLATQITGDTNLYVQSGGGIIGAGKHLSVSTAAQQFIAVAQNYFAQAAVMKNTPLPVKNGIQFIFLTNNGKYCVTEDYSKLENKSSQWLPLFEQANLVIHEMRNSSGKGN